MLAHPPIYLGERGCLREIHPHDHPSFLSRRSLTFGTRRISGQAFAFSVAPPLQRFIMADVVGDSTPTNEAMSVDIPCLMHCNGQDSQTQLPVQLAQPVPMESVKNHILQLVTEGIGSPRNLLSPSYHYSTTRLRFNFGF